MRDVWLGNVLKVRRVKVIAAGLLLVLQPFYGIITALPVRAASGIPGSIIINEFSSSTTPDWVELYNTTTQSISVTDWQVRTTSPEGQRVSATIVGHGFLVVELGELLNDAADTIELLDSEGAQMNAVAYGGTSPVSSPGASESAARTPDQGSVWTLETPTKGYTNNPDSIAPTTPSGGDPSGVTKASSQFAFTWQPSIDDNLAALRYELRASQDRAQVESDNAWRSGLRYETSLPFEAISGAPDGDWYWQIQAVDSAGNKSSWSDVWHVVVDTNGPGILVNQPSATLYGGPGMNSVPFEATIWDRSGVKSWTVTLDGVDVSPQVSVTQGPSELLLTTSFDTALLSDGDHTLAVTATDELGHTGTQLRLFSIDKTAPVLQVNVEEGGIVQGVVPLTLTADEAHPGEYGLTIFSGETALESGEAALQVNEATDQRTSSLVLSYNWDTTQLPDGSYQLQFTGKDAAGNESVLVRNIVIDNVPSFGGGTLTVDTPAIPLTDPLLDQLSKQLTQPFITPKAFAIAPIEAGNIADRASQEAAKNTQLEIPVTDQNPQTAVAPSEGGWRIFGVLWYWWLLLGVTIGVTYRRVRKVIPSVVA